MCKLLFTAGMTLIDSVDSVLMVYSYTNFPEHSWAIFERPTETLHLKPKALDETLDTEKSTALPRVGTPFGHSDGSIISLHRDQERPDAPNSKPAEPVAAVRL